MGLFSSLGVATQGLAASQLALDISGQNIANANTEGYSRKRLSLSAASRTDPIYGSYGMGVEINSIDRIRDSFVDTQINEQTQALGYSAQINTVYERIENVFQEPSDYSLNTNMQKFWDSFADLANNPTSVPARNVVKANADVMIDTFHSLSGQLRNMSNQKNDDISMSVNEINKLVSQIHQLNKEIGNIEITSGKNANDSRDARDLAIKKLSEFISLETREEHSGMISVLTEGIMIVSPQNMVTLEPTTASYKRDDGTSFTNIGVRFGNTKKIYTPSDGKLKALFEARDEILPTFESYLDEMANTFVDEVNAVHREGFTFDGKTGIDFFENQYHEEETKGYWKPIEDLYIGYDAALLGAVDVDLPLDVPATTQINDATVILRDINSGVQYSSPADFQLVNLGNTWGIRLMNGGAIDTGAQIPLVIDYTFKVPLGTEMIKETFSSNIKLSAAISTDVLNIAAAGGAREQAFVTVYPDPSNPAEAMGDITSISGWHYIHYDEGPDADFSVVADNMRVKSTILEDTLTVRSGSNVLKNGVDFMFDAAKGQFSLINPVYNNAPLEFSYNAKVAGTAGSSDNANALQISELRHEMLMHKDVNGKATTSIDSFYSSFVAEMGIKRNEAISNSDTREFLLQQFELQQEDIAGVSLDEEMGNLVKYQHTYQASARVISAVDQMLQVLLNM